MRAFILPSNLMKYNFFSRWSSKYQNAYNLRMNSSSYHREIIDHSHEIVVKGGIFQPVPIRGAKQTRKARRHGITACRRLS